jgi:hypothetical protein
LYAFGRKFARGNYRDIAGKEEWGRRFGRNQVYEVKRYADALD